VQKNV